MHKLPKPWRSGMQRSVPKSLLQEGPRESVVVLRRPLVDKLHERLKQQ